MKKLTLIVLSLLFVQLAKGQFDEGCLPDKLMVAAENLNFREKPNTESRIIGQLTNSELLTLIEIHEKKENIYWNTFEFSWVKVQRIQTGEIGYVFGKYLKTPEMAYLNYHDTDRIQKGNWYGIYQEGGKVKIEKTTPKISELDEGFSSIVGSSENHKILVCSQDEIKEGEINGHILENDREYLKIGIKKRLIRIGDFEFSLVCTGEVELNPPSLIRKNEKIIFLTTEIDGSRRHYVQQDLSDCISQFGEVGYQIHFVGDLNDDGIPELLISEGTTHGGNVYYFRSNKEGKLELVSITGVSRNC
jgi:hypothetical protein